MTKRRPRLHPPFLHLANLVLGKTASASKLPRSDIQEKSKCAQTVARINIGEKELSAERLDVRRFGAIYELWRSCNSKRTPSFRRYRLVNQTVLR